MNIQSLQFVLDINRDGRYSTWEYWEAIKWVYTLPGRLLVEFLGNIPTVASTVGIRASAQDGYASLGSIWVTAISLIFWVAVLIWLMSLHRNDEPDQTAVSQDYQARRRHSAPPM